MDGRIAVLSIAAFAGVLLAGAVVQAGGLPSFGGEGGEEEEHARPVSTVVPAALQPGAALVTTGQDGAAQPAPAAAVAPAAQGVPVVVNQAPATRAESRDATRRSDNRNERENHKHHDDDDDDEDAD